MRRMLLLFTFLLLATACQPGGTQTGQDGTPPFQREESIPYQIEVIAENLDVPWAIDIAPDGRIFFTERPGHVRVIEDGKLRDEPLISFSAPFLSQGEGGLLGLALDPQFERNQYLYVYHSYQENNTIKNRVLRLKLNGNRAEIDRVLIDELPGNRFHNGGRIKIGPDGYLYITTGDALLQELAQDLSSPAGKILRIGLDGSIPPDNPFGSSPVYSWGHRNPQGLAWHPSTGVLFSSEHGPSAHDELNLIEPGGNYGWPRIEGDEEGTESGIKMRKPILHSGERTWAPSGMDFVRRGPWQGDLLVANLRGEQVLRIRFNDSMTVEKVQELFKGEFGRLRDIVEGPDGSLYLLTNNRDGRGEIREGDDKIIKLTPVHD